MLRNILIIGGVFFAICACNNDCEENPPKPLSFNIQWVDANGKDAYESKLFAAKDLEAFYKDIRENVKIQLTVSYKKGDSTQRFIDMMPLVRKAYSLKLDSVFIAPNSTDIDTIALKVVNEKNDCFTTIYRFEKLEYNGKKLSGTDTIYKIQK